MGPASLRLVCLKSLTNPTIWTSSAEVRRDVRFPTASRPRPNFLANCSLTLGQDDVDVPEVRATERTSHCMNTTTAGGPTAAFVDGELRVAAGRSLTGGFARQ